MAARRLNGFDCLQNSRLRNLLRDLGVDPAPFWAVSYCA